MPKINKIVRNIFNHYDQNNNGQINIKEESSREAPSVSYRRDTVNIKVQKHTYESLFKAADRHGNRNGEVSRDELAQFIRSEFDKNGDNKLNNNFLTNGALNGITIGGKKINSSFLNQDSEYERFNRVYPERTYTTDYVRVKG